MSGDALREGFREVLRDPALLLIEIGWRWTFGTIAVFAGILAIFFWFGEIAFDPRRLETLAAMTPWQIAAVIAETLRVAGVGLLRVVMICGTAICGFWIVLCGCGRYATLSRPALTPGASLRNCLALNIWRALLTIAAIGSAFAITIAAGLTGSLVARGGLPDPLMVAAVLFPGLFVVAAIWAAVNWYVSLGFLFYGNSSLESLSRAWGFVSKSRDGLIEISLVIGVLRTVALVAAVMLSVAAAALVRNPPWLLADLLTIALLYFLIADFFYMARLAAYACLRSPRRSSAVEDVSVQGTSVSASGASS